MKKVFITGIATALLLSGCNKESETQQTGIKDTQNEIQPAEATQATENKPNLGITAEQYGAKLNAILQDTDFEDKTITELLEDDTDKVFITDYPHAVSLVGEVSENDQIESLTFTTPVDGNRDEHVKALTALTIASMKVLTGESDEDKATPTVNNLMGQTVKDYEEYQGQQRNSTVVGGNVYVIDISDKGIRLFIESDEDSRFVR